MIAKSDSNKEANAHTKQTKATLMTKRQKLKVLQNNDLNKTPQQPRIKSAAQRAKTYIMQSGLGLHHPDKNNNKNKPQQLLDPKLDLDSPEMKFGRSLASSEASGRHKSVNKLKFYLKARCDIANEHGGFSELDLMKLWKGLWYCLYMADKVPVQNELSKRLCELLWCFEGTEEEDEYAAQTYLDMCDDDDDDNNTEFDDDEEMGEGYEEDESEGEDGVTMKIVENTLSNSNDDDDDDDESDEEMEDNDKGEEGNETEEEEEPLYLVRHCRGAHLAALFIRTFFATVRREWGNMDKYRVDKFYTLIRLMMGEVYKYMGKRHWNYGIIRLFNDHLHDEVLSQIPNGIRYHIIDLALEQLAIVNTKFAPLPLTENTFVEVMEPFFGLCQSEQNPTVQSRVLEKVLHKFLLEYSVVGDKHLGDDDDDDDHENDTEDEDEDYTMDNVHVGSISEFIFSLGSHPETKDKYRESLYSMHKMYEKRLKLVGKDVETSIDNDDNVDDEEEDYDDAFCETSEEPEHNDEKDDHPKEEKSDLGSEPMEEDPPTSKKKSKKKTKKESQKEHKEKTKEKTNETTSTAKSGSKKRKTTTEEKEDEKDMSEVKNLKPDYDNSEVVKSEEPKKKQKKEKKKKKKQENDEIIMISTADQKQAIKATFETKKDENENENNPTPDGSKKKSKKKKKASVDVQHMESADGIEDENNNNNNDDDDDDDDDESPNGKTKSRRVSFGRVNYSKSYKASMKGLKTMESPSTATRTPEKGILLKKSNSDTKDSGEKTKKRRKKSKKSKN